MKTQEDTLVTFILHAIKQVSAAASVASFIRPITHIAFIIGGESYV